MKIFTIPKIEARNILGQKITEWHLTDSNVEACVDNLLHRVTNNVKSVGLKVFGFRLSDRWYRKLGFGIVIDIPTKYAHVLESRCTDKQPFRIQPVTRLSGDITRFEIVRRKKSA